MNNYYNPTGAPQPVQPQPISTVGYAQPAVAAAPTVVVQQTTTTNTNSSGLRDAIPELPMVLAVILCIVNILLPGIGTVIAGFSVLCCGNVGQSQGSRVGTFCINFWVGWLQLLLSPIFLIGWVWSIIWGVAFIGLAASANDKSQQTTTTTVASHALPQAIPTATTTFQHVV